MNGAVAIVRNELRILRHDPVPAVILVAMPLLLMAFLSPSLGLMLAAEGYDDATGAQQAVPGMISVFSFFVVAIVGFNLFREHGWRTWPRVTAAGLGTRDLLLGKLAVPAAMLLGQHLLLFLVGLLLFDLTVPGSWFAVALVSLAYAAVVLAAGLAAAATLATIQQLNAVTNLGVMLLGGLGGGLVPLATLPGWVQAVAPVSPVYWSMRGYRSVVLDGGGIGDVLLPVAVLALFAAGFAAVAVRWLRLDEPKRTWG